VSLSAAPSGDSGVLNWAASNPGDVVTFSLAHRDPISGTFSPINDFSGGTLDHIAGGLSDGTHSFRILALYNDGTAISSNIATITVSGGVIVGPVVTTPPTTTIPPTTTTATPNTTVPPTTTIPATTTSRIVQLTIAPPESDSTSLSSGTEETTTEQALEVAGTDNSDDEMPTGLIAAGAGLLTAAGLYLSRKWWLGLLAGTALGMLILGLFGRRPPGMPEDFEVFKKPSWKEDETDTVITWSEPEKGGKVTSYILQGYKGNKWLIIGEYDNETFTDTIEANRAEEVERWRMYAKGPGGTGKKTKSEDGL